MKTKIYLNFIFGTCAFITGLVLYINHDHKTGNFLILLAIGSAIKASWLWYYGNRNNKRLQA